MVNTLIAKKTRKTTRTKCLAKKAAAKKVLPEALSQQCKTIRKLVAQADRQDVRNRYQIAVHCLEVRQGDGGEMYGTNAVKKLAKKLGWGKSEVYDFANVASEWPDKTKFDELAAKTDKFNKPLTWTHFRRLAAEKDVVKRDQLIQDCLHNGWSVRELTRHIEGTAEPTAASDGTNSESKPLQGLAKVIQGYDLQVATLKRHTSNFGERLAAKISQVDPSDCNEQTLDQLLAVRTSLAELIVQFDATCRQFSARRNAQSDCSSALEDQMAGHADVPLVVEPQGLQGTAVESFR